MTVFKPRDRVHLKGHPHTPHTTGTVRSIDALGVHVLWDDSETITTQQPQHLEPAGEPMSQEPLDLTALRELAESQGNHWGLSVSLSAAKLKALLDYAEANRKGWGELLNDFARMEDRAIAAEAKVASVRELHRPLVNASSALYPGPHCSCGVSRCPTADALGGTP